MPVNSQQSQPLISFASVMQVHVKPRGGRLQYVADLHNCKLAHAKGNKPVNTFSGNARKGGLAGFSKGPFETVITFETAIRIEGAPQFSFVQSMANDEFLTIYGQIEGDTSGKRVRYEGQILRADWDFGLDKPSNESVTIHCGAPTFD
jgi:hypothetical protein